MFYKARHGARQGAPWREAWLRRYEKLHNVAVRRNAWQGVIWRAMARYGVLWRVFFRLRHSFFLFVMSFQTGDTSIVVFVNFLLLVIDLTLLKSSYI